MVDEPLKDVLDTPLDMTEERKHAVQMGQDLSPLKNSQAFKVFLGTIERDLEGVISDMEGVPFSIDASPKLFECRALMTYQRALLRRVDEYMAEANAIQQAGTEDKASDE